MTKRNGKPQNIHSDNLKPSTDDIRALAGAIEPRFLEVCELHGKKWGVGMVPAISGKMRKHFERWRLVVMRHRMGDFRNTLSEYQSMKEVAQWTLDEKCKLCGQENKLLEWPE